MIPPSPTPTPTPTNNEKLSEVLKSPRSALYVCESPYARKRNSRRVRFAPGNELVEEFEGSHFTEDDMEAMWFSNEEFRLLKRSYVFIVKLMEGNKGLLDDEEMCSRGLEAKTRAGSRRRRRAIESAVDAVLYEQERQWESDHLDAKRLAKVYRDATAHCGMHAFLVAAKDAQEVGRIRQGPSHATDALLSPRISQQRKVHDQKTLTRKTSLS